MSSLCRRSFLLLGNLKIRHPCFPAWILKRLFAQIVTLRETLTPLVQGGKKTH